MAYTEIPSDVFALFSKNNLPTSDISYLAIGAAPGTAMGETHLLVTAGQWFVFTRGSREEPLTTLKLKPGTAPHIQDDPFGALLLLPVDGRQDEVSVPLTPVEAGPLINLLASINGGDVSGDEEPHLLQDEVALPPQTSPESRAAAVPDDPDSLLQKAYAKAKRAGGKVGGLAAEKVGTAVDQALDLIELVAARAAKREHLPSIKVEANVQMMIGQIAIQSTYSAEDLHKLRTSQENKDPAEIRDDPGASEQSPET